nr:nucleotide sugar dehydrogenase [Corynebacterium sp. CNCTC7651]
MNDRTIGGTTEQASRHAADLYKSFCDGELLITDATSAEMVKLAENAYRDVNIAFANELSLIADTLDVDPWQVIELANRHPRVNILKPGPGVGGHCIAVDPWFLIESAPQQAEITRTAREVNDRKPDWVIAKAESIIDRLDPRKVAILGLSFKADIDDLRQSPALQIASDLASRNPETNFIAVEPNIRDTPTQFNTPNISWTPALPSDEELQLVVWLVDHQEFRNAESSIYRTVPILDACGNRSRLSR